MPVKRKIELCLINDDPTLKTLLPTIRGASTLLLSRMMRLLSIPFRLYLSFGWIGILQKILKAHMFHVIEYIRMVKTSISKND